jgi:NAD(P)-dependent dehydrogenase (short-subunit alcohol dehydrogenase family)
MRVALVTGASGGLGSVVTPLFLDAGYRVAAVALDWPKADGAGSARRRHASRSEQPASIRLTADLTSSAGAKSVVAATVKRFGGVDCLLHLVGAFTGEQRVEETPAAVWEEMLSVNLQAAAHMMRAAIPAMRARNGGRIIVIGSSTALQPVVTWSAFNAAIGGLCALVQTASAELCDAGITVNALLPTTIDTPAVRGLVPYEDPARWVDPASMASLMLWLCSDAGRDVTGAMIPFVGRQPHPCHHWHGLTDAV